MPFVEFIAKRGDQILLHTGEHLVLVAVSTAVAVAVALPLGVALARRPRAARAVIGVANVIQTIPSLALFGFLIPLPFLGGIGARTAIIALVLYAILPVLTNTFAGIRGIPAPIVEAATGMGMTPRQILRWVELPLAAPVILAGIRVATVISVGVATIAAAIGAGGLGTLIFRGVAMVDNRLVLAGAIPAALLAVGADLLLTWIERRIQPSRSRTAASSRS